MKKRVRKCKSQAVVAERRRSTVVADRVQKFFRTTSAHGCSRIADSSKCGKFGWSLAFCTCFLLFSMQIYMIALKFMRLEKITNVQLQFSTINFPAVTICNINPYKKSMARQNEEMGRLLTAFDSVMNKKSRKKRDTSGQQLQPAYIGCQCAAETCAPFEEVRAPVTNETVCLCFYNPTVVDSVPWPCYPSEKWSRRRCKNCYMIGSCDYVQKLDPENPTSCLCIDNLKICIRIAETDEQGNGWHFVRLWDKQNTPVLSADEANYMDALGFGNMTDPVAIATKGQENVLFATSGIEPASLSSLCYSAEDMIKKCVFQGKECSFRDFKTIIDPVYGQCFIFNHYHNMSSPVERAGPKYGLRLEVFVNTSEYLPTTDSRGLRIALNHPKIHPFPDSIGYYVPTGALSSFGAQLKLINRLPAPYGNCIVDINDDDFIFKDSTYSVEGCYRSCLQKYLVQNCSCGDPRFPVYKNWTNCLIADKVLRKCLTDAIAFIGGLSGSIENCLCPQPCREYIFEATMSSASWPATYESIFDCPAGMRTNDCMQYHLRESALIEIYFKELNYHELLETEAYGLPNLLADLGGQLGLWLGVSVLTCIELFVFVTSLFSVVFDSKATGHPQNEYVKKEKESAAHNSVHFDAALDEYVDANGNDDLMQQHFAFQALLRHDVTSFA